MVIYSRPPPPHRPARASSGRKTIKTAKPQRRKATVSATHNTFVLTIILSSSSALVLHDGLPCLSSKGKASDRTEEGDWNINNRTERILPGCPEDEKNNLETIMRRADVRK
jgi:hypothetical protein